MFRVLTNNSNKFIGAVLIILVHYVQNNYPYNLALFLCLFVAQTVIMLWHNSCSSSSIQRKIASVAMGIFFLRSALVLCVKNN